MTHSKCGKDGRPRDEICKVVCADKCPFDCLAYLLEWRNMRDGRAHRYVGIAPTDNFGRFHSP
jgi:hypothetical protein